MSDIDHEQTNMPVCPGCGAIDFEWYDGLDPKEDGDCWDVDCRFCKQQYVVAMCVSTTFDTWPANTRTPEETP